MIEVVTFSADGRRLDCGEPDDADGVAACALVLLREAETVGYAKASVSVYVDGTLLRSGVRGQDLQGIVV